MDATITVAIIGGIVTIIVALIGGFRAGKASSAAQQIAKETLDLSAMQATVTTFDTLGKTQAKIIDQQQDRINFYETHWEPKRDGHA